jgi:glutamate/tyrosine decarboxylase-like PLP-dependent enzyme
MAAHEPGQAAPTRPGAAEVSLDPEDWAALRTLGHRMVDDLLGWLETVRDRPVWRPIPPEVKARFREPLPREAQGAEQAYRDFQSLVLPHPMGNVHPRFWGWVIGTGSPLGALAEMLAAGMNPNCGGADHIAGYVEAQVLDWCKAMLGYPADASGILVSGGSVANLLGLAVARNRGAGWDVRRRGLGGGEAALTVYASVEAHSSVQKAVELLGLGSDALRLAPVNEAFEVDVPALAALIEADRAAGARPCCLVGNAGTVRTGAMDDLEALADLAAHHGLWFHVDGAFGALAALVPEYQPRLRALARADSLAFDLHKWMCLPIEVGVVLVRDRDAHRQAFALNPDYLARGDRGLASGPYWMDDFGIQLSRSFRALKVWLCFKAHGLARYAEVIAQNVAQARYLASLVDAAPDLERLAPVPLNIVVFRFTQPGATDGRLNALNAELLIRLQESGAAVATNATVGGRYGLRVANVNHRSRREDFDRLVSEVRRLGTALLTEGW